MGQKEERLKRKLDPNGNVNLAKRRNICSPTCKDEIPCLGFPWRSSGADPPGRGPGGPPAGYPATPIPGAPKRPRPPPQAPQSPRGFSHRTKMFTWQPCQTRLRENYAEILALGDWPHSPLQPEVLNSTGRTGHSSPSALLHLLQQGRTRACPRLPRPFPADPGEVRL